MSEFDIYGLSVDAVNTDTLIYPKIRMLPDYYSKELMFFSFIRLVQLLHT